MQEKNTKIKRNKYSAWYYLEEAYYPCKVCNGQYLAENYDFKTHKCKKCLAEDKKSSKQGTKENTK